MKEITLEEVKSRLKSREALNLNGEDLYLEIPEELQYLHYTNNKKDRHNLVVYSVEAKLPEGIEDPEEIARAYEAFLSLDNAQYREVLEQLQSEYNSLVHKHNLQNDENE
jgi:hypothetical protein